MKKMISVLMLVLSLNLVLPKKAEAFGIVWGAPIVSVLAGAGLAVGAVPVMARANRWISSGSRKWGIIGRIVGVAAAAIFIVGGAIFLDDASNDFKFTQISAEKAKDMSISAIELESYNSEVDELNALKSEVHQRLTREANPSDEYSKMLWQNYLKNVSPETVSVFKKVIEMHVLGHE